MKCWSIMLRSMYSIYLCFTWSKRSLSMVDVVVWCVFSNIFCIKMVELRTFALTDIVWGNVNSIIYLDWKCISPLLWNGRLAPLRYLVIPKLQCVLQLHCNKGRSKKRQNGGTDDGTLSRPRICKPLYGPSQGDETGDWTDDGTGLLHVIRLRYSIFSGGQTSTVS